MDVQGCDISGFLRGGILHPAIRFVVVRPLHEYIDPHVRSWRLGATMFTVFGGLALLIAAVGPYSLLAFSVERVRLRATSSGACQCPSDFATDELDVERLQLYALIKPRSRINSLPS